MSDLDRFQSLWAAQKPEEFSMSLADIRSRASRFEGVIRRRNWIEYAAGALTTGVFAWVAYVADDVFVRAGCALIILGNVYVVWRLSTLARASSVEDALGATSVADFHRTSLVRQRDALQGVWRWYLGPLLPGLLTFLAGATLTPANPAPLAAKLVLLAVSLALAGAVFIAIGALNAHAAKKLQREIDALDRARA